MHRKHRGSGTHCRAASVQCHAPSSLQPWLRAPAPTPGHYAQALLQGSLKHNTSANTQTNFASQQTSSGDAVAQIHTSTAATIENSEQAAASRDSSSDQRRTRADMADTNTTSQQDMKPKRKRSRRRKKGSETGALSDSGMDLVRAHSSSNVSRTSTVDNDFLHFEDENEFPNLLNAVGGLQADAQQLGAVSISYCDILKGQAIKVP